MNKVNPFIVVATLTFGLLLLPEVASADISDAVFFLSEPRPKGGLLKVGATTVVHYYRESCSCCLEKAAALKSRETPHLHYSSVLAVDGQLPRYEVYDESGKLTHSGKAARLWVGKNFSTHPHSNGDRRKD